MQSGENDRVGAIGESHLHIAAFERVVLLNVSYGLSVFIFDTGERRDYATARLLQDNFDACRKIGNQTRIGAFDSNSHRNVADVVALAKPSYRQRSDTLYIAV